MSQFAQRDQDHDAAAQDRPADAGAARAPGRRRLTDGLTRRGAGQPLPGELRAELEPAIGSDLGGVRLHTGPDAAADADQLDARAFAIGQDVHFGAGQYTPESAEGRHLIAHEVAHTVQQRGAPEAPARAPLEVSQPGDRWEAEADAFAEAFGSLAPHTVSPGSTAGVARVHLAPKGGPTSAKCETGVRALIIDDNLSDAERALRGATGLVMNYSRIIELLIESAVDGAAEQAESDRELAGLRKAIKGREGPNILRLLLDLGTAAVSVATGIGAIAAAASAISIVGGINSIVSAGNSGSKAIAGSSTEVEHLVAENIAMLNQHLQRLNATMQATEVVLGQLTAILIGNQLDEAATNLVQAATGMAPGQDTTTEVKGRLARIVAQSGAIKTGMGRLNVLVDIGGRLGFEQIATGTQARSLAEFLAERARAGEIDEINLVAPQEEAEVMGFRWVGSPERPISSFRFRTFPERFGYRIDGGQKWLPTLLQLGLLPIGTDPARPTELALGDKAETVMHACGSLGVMQSTRSTVRVIPPWEEPIELPISTWHFWDYPAFGALYEGVLRHPQGHPVWALWVQFDGVSGEQQRPGWLLSRLEPDSD